MIALGMGIAWVGYTSLLYGYCLIRGYDVTLWSMIKPGAWTGQWPPELAPNTELIPTGATVKSLQPINRSPGGPTPPGPPVPNSSTTPHAQ